MSEVIEGNKLIAEFMDYVLYFDDHDYEEVYSHKHDKYRLVRCPPEQLTYHKEWNELMPVVEKIESLSNYCVEIRFDSCTILEATIEQGDLCIEIKFQLKN